MKPEQKNTPVNILLADDAREERFFFSKALKSIPILTQLTIVENGEKLMDHLYENSNKLPDVLFLDLNMPRKNGAECLKEIKGNEKLKQVPIIIYSQAFLKDVADLLYKNGADYYLIKCDMDCLEKIVHYILDLIVDNKLTRPTHDKFVLNHLEPFSSFGSRS